jgi:hypothetical protein
MKGLRRKIGMSACARGDGRKDERRIDEMKQVNR